MAVRSTVRPRLSSSDSSSSQSTGRLKRKRPRSTPSAIDRGLFCCAYHSSPLPPGEGPGRLWLAVARVRAFAIGLGVHIRHRQGQRRGCHLVPLLALSSSDLPTLALHGHYQSAHKTRSHSIRFASDQLDDRVDFGVGQRRDVRFRRPAGDRVDLHQLQLSAGGGDFVEPVAEGFELRRATAARRATRMNSD